MRIGKVSLTVFALGLLLMAGGGHATMPPASQAVGVEVAQAIADLERERTVIVARIAENEKTMSTSQAIIAAARAKANVQAERTATEAYARAEEARRRNETALRTIDISLAQLKKGASGSITPTERDRAKARLTELRRDISDLQQDLRACMAATTKTLAEREAIEKRINAVVDKCWQIYRDDLLTEIGTAGLGQLFKLRQKGAQNDLAELWSKARATENPNVKAQLLGLIEHRQMDIKLWEYNERMVDRLGSLRSSYDVYRWDQEEAPFRQKLVEGMDLIAGVVVPAYGLAKIDVVGVSSVASELMDWYRLRELDRQNAGCSEKVKSLSGRMEQKVTEVNCLETCLDNPTAGCADKCRGRTPLHTPPPLPN